MPQMQESSAQVGGTQLFSLLGADPGGGIKKQLGAFRPDFPVTGQVSLIRYAPDAGTVCTAGWEPTTPPTVSGPWRRDQEVAGCP